MYITETFEGNNLYSDDLDLSTRPDKSGLSLSGFTIIEMLVVLAIMAIILGLTVPAFRPISRTMKLKTAAQNLASTLEAARQYAITSAQNSYVVFPMSTSYTDMNGKMYKIYSSVGGTIGKWEALPKRIIVDSGSTFVGTTMSIPFPEDNNSSATVSCVKFKSNGAAELEQSIRLVDENESSFFKKVFFYDVPREIKIKDIGVE